MTKPYVLILSGPAGSGKSSVGMELWKKMSDRPALICLDFLKNIIYQAESSDTFLDLATKNALSLTQNFLDANRSVILIKAFGAYRFVHPFIAEAENRQLPVYYIKLIAPLHILISRNATRRCYSAEKLIEEMRWRKYTAPDERIEAIYRFCQTNAHSEGIEINTERFSLSEVVDKIYRMIAWEP